MPYINREPSGKLISVSNLKTEECTEFIDEDSSEYIEFLFNLSGINLKTLQSDLNLVRVIEDLVDILVAKSVISINDLPSPVQKKLLSRKSLRVEGRLSSQHDLIEL